MTKVYHLYNDQHQFVKAFESLDTAKGHLDGLRSSFADEGFYIVEMPVVHSSFPAHSRS